MSLADVAVQVAIGAVPLGVAYFAFRSATDANRRTQETAQKNAAANAEIEKTKVDAEAYERAKTIYQDALRELEKQLDRLTAQFDRINEQLAREQDTSNSLRTQIRTLQGQVVSLERFAATLRRQMVAAGLSPVLGAEGTPE